MTVLLGVADPIRREYDFHLAAPASSRRLSPGPTGGAGHRTQQSVEDEPMDSVVHFEMPYENRERMAKFYHSAFGWQTQMLGQDMNSYVVATTTETGEAGPPSRARSTVDSMERCRTAHAVSVGRDRGG